MISHLAFECGSLVEWHSYMLKRFDEGWSITLDVDSTTLFCITIWIGEPNGVGASILHGGLWYCQAYCEILIVLSAEINCEHKVLRIELATVSLTQNRSL